MEKTTQEHVKSSNGPLTGKRILVTGATGLVGGLVVEELLRQGAYVISLVRDAVPNSYYRTAKLFEQCVEVHGSLEDAELMLRIFNEYQLQGVMHLAAQTQVRVANDHPVTTLKANIEGSWNLFEAARQCPKFLEFFIVASSDKAYGKALQEQYDENHPLLAAYPYDVSKACADMIARCYAHTYQLPIVVTRCGNFFGPGDLNWDRLIPHVVSQFLQDKAPIIRSNGELVRDYFYVKDGALAYIFLAKKMVMEGGDKLRGEAFNFSYGNAHKVVDVVNVIANKMGKKHLAPVIQSVATHEIEFQSLSSKKARQVLNWAPKFDFEDAISETIDWYRSSLGEARAKNSVDTLRG